LNGDGLKECVCGIIADNTRQVPLKDTEIAPKMKKIKAIVVNNTKQ
jgi:hypothetical protein